MLPQMTTPIYTVNLPSNGEEIRVRPFLVKEEKLLLMAAQSKDPTEIINVTKQIVTNCMIDVVDVNKMPFFDVDYLFLTLRAKSISEKIEMNFTCNNNVEPNKRCGAVFPVDLDISKASITKEDDVKNEVVLSDKVIVTMKYPRYSTVKKIVSDESEFDKRIRLVQASIDHIFDGTQTYNPSEIPQEDFDKFIDGLTKGQLDKLMNWLDKLPELSIKVDAQCPSCGFNHKIQYKDFTSFFF